MNPIEFGRPRIVFHHAHGDSAAASAHNAAHQRHMELDGQLGEVAEYQALRQSVDVKALREDFEESERAIYSTDEQLPEAQRANHFWQNPDLGFGNHYRTPPWGNAVEEKYYKKPPSGVK